jgi:hypothetical protein
VLSGGGGRRGWTVGGWRRLRLGRDVGSRSRSLGIQGLATTGARVMRFRILGGSGAGEWVEKTCRIVNGSKGRIFVGEPRVKYETHPTPVDSWGGCGSYPQAKIAPRVRTVESDIYTRW